MGVAGGQGPVRVVATLVAATCLALAVVLLVAEPPGDAAPAILGEVAPPIVGEVLDGEGGFDLAAQRGRWVVVNFFAPWCTECLVELPELVELDRVLGEDGTLVGVVLESDPHDVRRSIASSGADWPFVIDADGATAVGYGQLKVPETFVIAPDSRVVARFDGATTADEILRVIDG